MRYLLILVFLFGSGDLTKDTGGYYGIDSGENYNGEVEQDDNFDKDLIRPCSLSDWDCIRNFLAANSKCTPSFGPVPDPLKLPTDKFYIPRVNLTITHTNLRIRGLRSAKVTEFYLNKRTGNLVIAINVQRLNQTSPRSYFTYQRTGKEPIIRSDFTTVTYDSATFTAVIPRAPHLRLDRAEIHADIHDSRPKYAIGPRAGNSTDPDVIASFVELIANIPSIIQEAFVFQSSLITSIYIQQYLCDFGLETYKNYLSFVRNKGYTQVQRDQDILYQENGYPYNDRNVKYISSGPLNYIPKTNGMYYDETLY